MTRKKWNRLKRQRPELFKNLRIAPWERMDAEERNVMRLCSKQDVVAKLTAFQLGDGAPTAVGHIYFDPAYPNSDVTVNKVVDLKDAQA